MRRGGVLLVAWGLTLAAAAAADTLPELIPPGAYTVYDAASRGDWATVKRMLDDDPSLARVRLKEGITPLHGAALVDEPRTVRELVRRHAEVDARGGKQRLTPLFLAAINEHAAVMRALLDAHADANGRCALPTEFDAIEGTPLHLAAIHGRSDIALLLLTHGARPDAKTTSNATASDYAWKSGHDSVGHLVGAYRRLTPSQARTVGELIVAIDANDSLAVDKLLRRDRRLVNGPLEDEVTPLHLAAEVGSQSACAALLARGADPTAKRKAGGLTPTGVAFHAGHPDLATFLNRFEAAAMEKKNHK